jgi:DNA topoisomerase-1
MYGGHAEGADKRCENCGSPMAMKRGRFGQFLACPSYPDCKTTRKIQKAGKLTARDAVVEELCPQCNEQRLVLKQGRYGSFTACSNYPKCKYVKQETTGVSCPECGIGDLVVKKSTRGAFYGCGNYPTCKFTLRDKPIPQTCPECGARFVVEHTQKDGSRELQCRTEDCRFREADLSRSNEFIRSGT